MLYLINHDISYIYNLIYQELILYLLSNWAIFCSDRPPCHNSNRVRALVDDQIERLILGSWDGRFQGTSPYTSG